jgi:hypothetical protein
MNILQCPITDEKILSISSNGVRRRENYTEVFFYLTDGSRMRIAMSKNAKDNLTEKQADDFIKKIKYEWKTGLNNKVLEKEMKKIHLRRIEKMGYNKIEDRNGIILQKKTK